jgi:hypothetical protein
MSGPIAGGQWRSAGWVIAVSLAVIACLAGCGSARYRAAAAGGPAGDHSRGRPATGTSAPTAGTRAEARALAQRLLSGLMLPNGTRRLPGRPAPGALSQPPFTVGDPDVDLYRFFTLPMSTDAAQQYGQAHPPAGLTFGTVSSGYEGVSLEADLPPRALPPGIEQAELVYTIAPGTGDSSLLRAEVQMIIFPPRSAAEYLDPASVGSVTVRAIGGGTRDALRIITSRPVITRLARLLDGAHAFPPGAMRMCPAELFPLPQLTFTPVSARRPTAVVDPTDCGADAVFANGVRQPELVDTGLFYAAERLLPPASRDVPGIRS